VFPVLEKIYGQNANQEEWELIVTNNGDNAEFHERMVTYASQHENLIYKKNNAFLFENQIEALRIASGAYLKFMNHRSILEPGAIQWMINVIKENIEDKPILYLSTGALNMGGQKTCTTFDEFVRSLRHYASWTTGVGVWKSDFDKIPEDWVYNKISPHSDVLFWVRDREKYIIDDTVWCHEIDNSHVRKGKYDLYRAFGVEEITVTLNLLNDRSITADTFKYIVKCYEKCVSGFYLMFNILHEPCSYALDGFDDAMGIFLDKRRVLIRAYAHVPMGLIKKILR